MEYIYLDVLKEITIYKDLKKAKFLSKFFRTGKGEYGEGDEFWGINVPVSRRIAYKYKSLRKGDILKLLKNKVHEIRLIALLILVYQYKINDKLKNDKEKEKIVNFYLKNIIYVNNWDLVDLSSYNILGEYLKDKKDKSLLIKLSESKNLWKERISIVSTYTFIKNNDFDMIYFLSYKFLNHKHDLIHKACGWMLREAGKRDEKKLKNFLNKNIKKMPRTMFRYSIEKFNEKERKEYLKK